MFSYISNVNQSFFTFYSKVFQFEEVMYHNKSSYLCNIATPAKFIHFSFLLESTLFSLQFFFFSSLLFLGKLLVTFPKILCCRWFYTMVLSIRNIQMLYTHSFAVFAAICRSYFKNRGKHLVVTKKGTFLLQKSEKNTPNLTSTYVHSFFTIVLIF